MEENDNGKAEFIIDKDSTIEFMKKIYTIFVCIWLLAGFVACEKDKDFALNTLAVNDEMVTPSFETAQVSCSFKTDATISDAFVQYSLSSSFAKYEVAKMTEDKGKYTAQLTGLVDNTTYYIRYSVSNKYSSVVAEKVAEFKTLPCTVPTIVVDSIAGVKENQAKVHLHLTSTGGAVVTDMGICWSKQANPTIEDIHKSTKDTVAVLDMTDLQPSTTYYVRAYATNDVGTAYGEEVSFTTKEQSSTPNNGTENGYAYVDLGLSVKWATCNVGASKPEDYGNYYAWGETSTKTEYTEDNSKTCGSIMGDISVNSSYDAARANWGGLWRLPTKAEMKELINKCNWKWTTQNGVKGYKVTGPNGNSIFLPAAGRHYNERHIGESNGYYWSATSGGLYWAEHINFYPDNEFPIYSSYRNYGQPIRPVSN